jgi:hypothetical protein
LVFTSARNLDAFTRLFATCDASAELAFEALEIVDEPISVVVVGGLVVMRRLPVKVVLLTFSTSTFCMRC